MTYNLTEKQRELLRWIVQNVTAGHFPESFVFPYDPDTSDLSGMAGLAVDTSSQRLDLFELDTGALDALASDRLILLRREESMQDDSIPMLGFKVKPKKVFVLRVTLTGRAYHAVQTNFKDEQAVLATVGVSQPQPAEIKPSLARFRRKYPDPLTTGFLIMRFMAAKPFAKIVEAIKQTAEKHGIKIVRADENEFHADLWGNVRTHLHGCGFGIAIYERIETNEPNANVGLEVGYLMAMNKPVLLLKDKTLPALQADLAGKLYRHFDPHNPEETIPEQLEKWLEDNGLLVGVKK